MRVWDGCTGERGQKKFVAFYIIIDMGNFADFLQFLNCYSALEEELTTAYTMKNKIITSLQISFLMFPSIELFSLVFFAIYFR